MLAGARASSSSASSPRLPIATLRQRRALRGPPRRLLLIANGPWSRLRQVLLSSRVGPEIRPGGAPIRPKLGALARRASSPVPGQPRRARFVARDPNWAKTSAHGLRLELAVRLVLGVLAGFVLLVYGKKMDRLPHLGVGVVLMAFPFFVSSAFWIIAIAAALSTLLWLAVKNGW